MQIWVWSYKATPFKVLLNEAILEDSRGGDMPACDSG
jgi:hypothetical protein